MVFVDSSGETCPEKKVLYKLISGLHSSISMHIAADYLLDESRNQVCVSEQKIDKSLYMNVLWSWLTCNFF